VESYVAELRLVSQAVLAVSRQLSTRDVLAVIVRSARTLAGARYAALGVPDDRGSFAEFVVAGMTQAQQRAIGPLPRQHGMLAALLKSSAPERLADIRKDPRFEGWPAAHPELTGFLGVPVKNGEDVLGIIFVANKRSGSFTARDEELLTLFAAHAAIALTNARLYERSRELSVLEERARLARELHDAVSQRLFSIRAHARAAEVLVAKDPARAARELAAIAEVGAQAYGELRAVIDGLAPPELDGLAESLRRYALLAGRAHGIAVRLTACDVPELDPRVQAAAFRVAQEALHNALRHSGASEISVTLSRTRSRVILEVADDGTGFDTGLASGGLGLASMRDRAAAVGGSLRVTSAPGAGTRVRLSVPA
jgi:signal transduction histidine kinase